MRARHLTARHQYDVDQYQRVEQLIGERLPAYVCEEEHVLTLLGRVEEALRLANEQLREKEDALDDKRKRKRARATAKGEVRGRVTEVGDGEADVAMSLVKKAHVKKKTWHKK